MSNQFRQRIKEQEAEELLMEAQIETPKAPVKNGTTTAFLKKLLTEGVVTKEAATEILPFIIFLCVLGMIYIANSHMAMKNIRSIDQLNKEVKELNYGFKSLKAELMFKSKLTAIEARVDTLGLKSLIEPPKRIIVN